MASSFPDHWGMKFTPTIHNKAEGPTDPSSITLPPNFVVCVTGAGKGLGYHIALAYARAGAKGICVSSRTKADLDKLAAEIAQVAPKVEVLVQTCDTMDDGEVEALAQAVWGRWGRCDVVVANAGVISKYVTREDGKEYLPVGMVEDGDLERVVQTNLMGTWRYVLLRLPCQAIPGRCTYENADDGSAWRSTSSPTWPPRPTDPRRILPSRPSRRTCGIAL